MATAKQDVVTKVVTERVPEDVIVLTLSKREARALYALARWVFGVSGTYAREVYSIRSALAFTNKLGHVSRLDFFKIDEDGDLEAKPYLPEDK